MKLRDVTMAATAWEAVERGVVVISVSIMQRREMPVMA